MRNVIIGFVLLGAALLVVFLMSGKDAEMAQPESTQQETPVVETPEPVEEVVETVTEAAEGVTETTEEAVEEVVEQAEGTVTETVETTQEQAEELVEDAVNEALGTTEAATETATEAAETAVEATETATESVAEEAVEAIVPEMSDPLSVENFDMTKANEMIDGSSLDVLQQNALKVGLEQAKDNPELLKAALDQVKSALGL